MKRMFACLLGILMLLNTAICPAMAAEEEIASTVEYMEDGSYIVITIEEMDRRGARTSTKVGSKSASYYSADDVLLWEISVTGEFQYDGTTSSCTYASGITTVYDTARWKITNESATAGDTTAYYTVTFARWSLGVVIDRPAYSISISCDPNGNLY